ncbi:UPF3 [Acanthosepion pharaonis]|uniref:UPF3 n=1 Tax=Acanthosepion pharaonis TaxID=158019 RepID=A0A812DXW8_ACAPH|nr:UPF3 [Sepia pharaonis]
MDERKKDRDQPPTKVVIRRLPPSLTPEVFLEQVSPLPFYDYFYFVKADMSLGSNAFTRAYINFPCPDDIYTFKDKFDDYVFVDKKGNEYSAVVEFAPFQKVPKKKMRKADTKKGTIEQDSEYQKFLEILKNPETEPTIPIEAYLEELENKKKELKANHGVPKMTTPLIEYIRRKKEEKKANIQRQREDRKKREHERKKAREEEKRRRKEKEKEKREEKKQKEKELLPKKDDQPIKLLKNPEREQEKQKEECDLGRIKDEPEKPIKEREKLRFSKENREKFNKLDRQGQERLKPGREGRFADRSKYSKDDRACDKSEKFKSNKDDRSGDKKNRDDKPDRQKHLAGKYNREDRSKCYQSVNNNNSNNCREDKKTRHDKQSKHDRTDKFDRPEKQDKYDRMDRQDKFDRSDKQDRLERLERHERSEKQDNDDFERSVHEKKSNKADKLDKAKVEVCCSYSSSESGGLELTPGQLGAAVAEGAQNQGYHFGGDAPREQPANKWEPKTRIYSGKPERQDNRKRKVIL